MKIDWKDLSKNVVRLHMLAGSGVTPVRPDAEFNHEIGGGLIDCSPEILEVKGQTLTGKDIRRYLWKHRKCRGLQRQTALVWTTYLPGEDMSYVGISVLVGKRTMDRTLERDRGMVSVMEADDG